MLRDDWKTAIEILEQGTSRNFRKRLPPAYLFIPTKNGNVCCIGGFHSFDFESGDANNGNATRFFVLNYSTWFQPSFFRDPTILDVTGLSHEISETYNDPFVVFDGVHDVTPWWLAPNGNCQDDLEVGDVIEGLPHQVFPITMPNGFTYHPQNEALLQWFEFQSPSSALNGAYSYPDLTTLTVSLGSGRLPEQENPWFIPTNKSPGWDCHDL